MTRIYLIDDHAMIREGVRAMLEGAGHEVIGEAADITPAIADLARLDPQVVLLDLNLGERSGFEVLVEIRKRRPDSKVIMLTMSKQPRHVAEALRRGANGYLLKDAPRVELLRAVDVVAGGGRYLAADVADLAVQGLTEASRSTVDLSPRERQVLVMVARGMTSAAIGEQLHLSSKTVDSYRSRLMAKLNLGDVPALVRWAVREGLIPLDDA